MLSTEALDLKVPPLHKKVIESKGEDEKMCKENSLQHLNPQERYVIEQIGKLLSKPLRNLN